MRNRLLGYALRLRREHERVWKVSGGVEEWVSFTQAELADRLNISQPSFAACEKSDNMRIGTLRRLVEATGGVLSLNVSIDGRNYCLSQPNFT